MNKLTVITHNTEGEAVTLAVLEDVRSCSVVNGFPFDAMLREDPNFPASVIAWESSPERELFLITQGIGSLRGNDLFILARYYSIKAFGPELLVLAAREPQEKRTVRFPIGNLVATPGALEALARSEEAPMLYVLRHQAGDWGTVCEDDQRANEQALVHGTRILSAYQTPRRDKLWVITEADRKTTTVLTPEEY